MSSSPGDSGVPASPANTDDLPSPMSPMGEPLEVMTVTEPIAKSEAVSGPNPEEQSASIDHHECVPNEVKMDQDVSSQGESKQQDSGRSSLNIEIKEEPDQDPPVQVERPKSPSPASEVTVEATSNPFYYVKWITFSGTRCPIITQEENGPCPLLSLMNLLLLRGKTSLPDGCEVISSDELVEKLAEILLESMPKSVNDDERLNYEQNINDGIALLPSIVKGLFVNIRFSGVTQFEYTDSLVIFDLLNVPLYHGWVVDPQSKLLAQAVGNLSYNELTTKTITDMSSDDEEKVRMALLTREFLEESALQLTFHGLCELNEKMRDGELAIMFRNNHFSTLYKQKGELFELMSDQGFLKEPSVVWQTLSTIDGDCQFVDHSFKSVPPKEPVTCDIRTKEQQIDQDHLLAMTLAEEDKNRSREANNQTTDSKAEWSQLPPPGSVSDEELALRLQEEEREAALAAEQQHQRQSGGGGGRRHPHQHQRSQSQPSASQASGSSSQTRSSQGQSKKLCVIS
ncbi:hypothetical protein TCAL_11084 [Tigriopus californicus]|uniref:Ubiquitin carboxyl-terminal hydrolase n=1 Tax=Tigriopus californicus TaxID=6832 RepID=A0A553NZ10_TIGCA|nr:ubiquitin carboxyl-terminal hydrolase MINDY-2-like [Tigriopus californicus]TRY70664.1 hypothetical protein TCAL_11084 [Tigriopus californicus]